ncbi:MAG: hypothetical protein Tsb0014_24100 [Pleurocapsa sp.]
MIDITDSLQTKGIVLVIDDTPNVLQLLFKYLQDANYRVLVAQDGAKAVKIAKLTRPDLILLDIMMFGMDGFEIGNLLKSDRDTQDIPIIFMTAIAATKSKLKAFELGAVDYITKPIDRQELLARVNTHIALKNLNYYLAKEVTRKELLFKITDCIRQSLDLNIIVQTTTKKIFEATQCDRATLAQRSNDKMVIKSQFTRDRQVAALPEEMLLEDFDSQSLESQLIAPILLEDDPANFLTSDNLEASTAPQKFVPTWGWLILEKNSSQQWQPEDADLCRDLTAQIAIAIKQGLLYEQLKINNTKLKSANQQLQQLALLDPLTQVFNRRYFDQQLDLEWRRLRRNTSSPLSLVMCDVDCFKLYNDTYGHQQGDECLQQVAQTISQIIKRPADILARYGGEEFIIALPDTPQAGAIKIAESMRSAVKNLNIPHVNSTVDSVVTISLGVASAIPDRNNHPAMLIESADQGLYLAKSRGRDRLAVYQGDISRCKHKQNNELYWTKRIRRALEENLFSLYAQPINPLGSSDRQRRFEILLRLTDRGEEVISPNTFMAIAARNSLMPQIDTWVVDNLLNILEEFDELDWNNYHFSINLSGASLNSKYFLNYLSQKLTKYHLPAELFCFEITETVAIANLTQASRFIDFCKHLGCSFALDDFGKGMSSLSYLKCLPVDYLKIDGSFITELHQNKIAKAIVGGIHRIAEGIGLKTVAEFVENQTILDTVRNLKVDYAQGYHFGRPTKLIDFLQ